MKHYSPTGRRNRGRPLKRLLNTCDRNGATSGLTPWQIYDDDDNSSRFYHKCTHVFTYSSHYSCKAAIESARQFRKWSNIKFHENPSCWSRAAPCGQAATSKLIVGFRHFSNAPNKPHFKRSKKHGKLTPLPSLFADDGYRKHAMAFWPSKSTFISTYPDSCIVIS